MKDILNKLMLGVVALAVVVILVLLVKLFIGGKDGGAPTPTPSGTPSADVTPEEPSATPNGEDAQETPPAGESPSPEPPSVTGDRIALQYPGGEKLSLIYDEAVFTHDQLSTSDVFIYNAVAMGRCSLEVCYVPDTAPDALQPGFLDNYLDYTDIDYGQDAVGASPITGLTATAKNDELQVDAWFIEIEGGTLAIVASYLDGAQRDALYAILGSMELDG
ncbi:MAG: hypothetical protein LBT12_02805 [Oscillospiraceae bacterium]|jgi:hypothetical protein|nr:hypothetical protein [Oscillospiraceae bacterium]